MPTSENPHLSDKFRRSRPEVFCKKGVLGNFAKFTGKHLCQSLLFNKVALWHSDAGALWHRRFLVNFVKFLRIPFFIAASANLPKGGNFYLFILLNLLVS